jgi:guanylate kinase
VSRSPTSNDPEQGLLVVLTGPSGAGKSTLVARAQAQLPNVRFSVSYTTRAPRPGEVDGVHYHFVDASTFARLRSEGAFLESALVHGNHYGTHRGQVEEAVQRGEIVLLDVDVQGARSVRASGIAAKYVFILPPSIEVLAQRLYARGTDAAEVIERRLAIAKSEMAEARAFDHEIVNDDLERAAREFIEALGQGAVPRRGAARTVPPRSS